MGFTRPVLAAAMAIFMVSLAGLPPTGGFVAKFYIFSAAIETGHVWLVVVAVLNSVVSVYYYLRLVVLMYMNEPAAGGEEHPGPGAADWAGPYAFFALFLAVIATLNLGLFPGVVMELARHSSLLLN